MNTYKKIMDNMSKIIFVVTGVMAIIMVLVIFIQVFGRFVLNMQPHWSEEVARVLMIYTGLLGASLAYRERMHIGIRLFIDKIKPSIRRFFLLFIDIVIGSFALFMVIWGIEFVTEMSGNTLPATKISVGWTYLPLPISGFLMFCFAIEKILNDITGKNKQDFEPSPVVEDL